MRICLQSEPKEKAYHKLFKRFIFVFDELLKAANGKAAVVSLVVRSGSRNHSIQATVEVEEPRKKQKTEHTPHSMVMSQTDSVPRRLRMF